MHCICGKKIMWTWLGKYTCNKYVGVIIIIYTDIISEIYSNTGFKISNSCYYVFTKLICPFYDVFPILKERNLFIALIDEYYQRKWSKYLSCYHFSSSIDEWKKCIYIYIYIYIYISLSSEYYLRICFFGNINTKLSDVVRILWACIPMHTRKFGYNKI